MVNKLLTSAEVKCLKDQIYNLWMLCIQYKVSTVAAEK